ncbi:hypothetical protein Dimus_027010 [Dionaea muscipula]
MMDLIKRQRWEKLFKRRELVHVDAVKKFYARLTLSHYKKKEFARSSVGGVEIEFDHMRLASILGIHGNIGICEYINDVWEESKHAKPLEISRKFANDETIMEARRVKSIEMKPFQRFIHFLVMKIVVPRFRKRDTTSYMDLTYMDHLTRRRRSDDEDVAPAEEENEEEEEQNQLDFDWEVVVDEAALQGESGSDDQFFYAQVDVEGPGTEAPAVPVFLTSPGDSINVQKEPAPIGVDPSAPTGSIPDAIFSSLQADFERARANRIQADLEKAQAENARLLSLLQQAQSQPKP